MAAAQEPIDALGVGGMLDASACLSLLGRLYPISGSTFFLELESFLQRTPSDLPRRLLEHNRSRARRRGIGQDMELLSLDADVLVTFDPACRHTHIDIRNHPLSSRESSAPGRHTDLCISIEDIAPGFSREFRLPLQVLMRSWGDVQEGYHCYTHSLVFRDPAATDDAPVKRKTFAGVGTGFWTPMTQTFERVAFAGGSSSKASASVARYMGDACVTLTSELVFLNQSEAAALAWEEAKVDQLKADGTAWNRLDGGLKGMRMLWRQGFLPTERVSLRERDQARLQWRARTFLGGPGAAALQGADADLRLLTYHDADLTPAQTIEARRLAAQGRPAAEIAGLIGASDVALVVRTVAPMLAR
jgi:hypothetical protein